MYRDNPFFGPTEEFCVKYDGLAFDASVTVAPLEEFEGAVRRVLAEPKRAVGDMVHTLPKAS